MVQMVLMVLMVQMVQMELKVVMDVPFLIGKEMDIVMMKTMTKLVALMEAIVALVLMSHNGFVLNVNVKNDLSFFHNCYRTMSK